MGEGEGEGALYIISITFFLEWRFCTIVSANSNRNILSEGFVHLL